MRGREKVQKHRGTDMAEAETHSDPGVSKGGTADGNLLKKRNYFQR